MLKPTVSLSGNDNFLVSNLPPARVHYVIAAGIVAMLVCVIVITAPFSRVALSNTEMLLPAYAAAYFINGLATATLLLALYSIQRSRAVLVLSIGYLFSSLMVPPWVLTIPGLFAPLGLSEVDLQSTASIAAVRRLGFPLFVLAYAVLQRSDTTSLKSQKSVQRVIFASVTGTLVVAGGLSWAIITHQGPLPHFMRNATDVSELWKYVPATAGFLYVAGMVVLWSGRRSVLDLWLMVVLCTLIFEITVIAYLGGGQRLSIGWWAGRVFGLVSVSLILLVMLSQTTVLYAKLARSISAERRAREVQRAASQAMSASIAHEINQPLASMVTNADAALRWLDNKTPVLEEARAALNRIASDGHRAGKVIDGIRTIYGKGVQEREPLDLNLLIEEAIRRSQRETQFAHIDLQISLDERSPAVTGNPVQLQQVASNLIANAIDAMSSVKDRARVLSVKSHIQDDGNVVVSVGDTGTGLDPKLKHRIFEPLFTTKSDGMGMGLTVCSSIVEAHGGKLWATDHPPHGSIFHFTLPCCDTYPSAIMRHER